MSDINIIKSGKVTLAGLPARQIEYTSTAIPGLSLKKMQEFTVINNFAYVVSFGAEQAEYDKHIPDVENLINSIKINLEAEGAPAEEKDTARAEDLVLLSQKLKKGEGDFNNVIGQVKNIGSDTLEFIKIGLTVYDKNGDIVGTDSTYAESSTLGPNQKSSFDIFSSKANFEGMESYELSLSWQTSDGIDEYVDNAQIYNEN